MDTSPVWNTVATLTPSTLRYDISGKESGHFFYYRIKAKNGAGTWGEYAVAEEPAQTGPIPEVLSQVSNYPNPFNPNDGPTAITYLLNQAADVKIELFDVFGHPVYEENFNSGTEGAKLGPNVWEWIGENGIGNRVAKGVYFCRITVKGEDKTAVEVRKIAVLPK